MIYQGPNNEDVIDMKPIIIWTNNDRIEVSLIENGYNTGVFINKILLTDTAIKDNELKVEYGDTITAHYEDNYVEIMANAKINNPPVIQYEIIKDDAITIDASNSYDLDQDRLEFKWELIKGDIAYTVHDSSIKSVSSNNTIVFRLYIDDGFENVYRDIIIEPIEHKAIFPLTVSINAVRESYEGFNIRFDSSIFGGNEPYSYRWIIDNEIFNDKTFIKSFKSGIYNITLIVRDSSNNIEKDSMILNIYSPITKIAGDTKEGSKLRFTIAPVIEDAKYTWNFGDHSEEGIESIYTYNNDGVYKVILSIEYLEQIKSYEEVITIDNVKPDVSLAVDKNNIVEGDKVRFDIIIDDPGNDTFSIKLYSNNEPIFETETNSNSLTYEHIYATQGNYEHYIIVSDGNDIVESNKVSIIVGMSLVLPIIGLISAGIGSTAIIYKIKKPKFVKMSIEYSSGLDKNIRFTIDMEGGIEK